MKKLFRFLLALLPLGLSSQTVYSLQYCIETACANNLQVKQSGLLLATAETNFKQAKNNKLPNVNGNYSLGINNGRSIDPFTNGYITEQLSFSNAGLGADITLYNGGRLQNLIKQNELLAKAARQDNQQDKETLALNVILAYLQVLNSEDLLKLAITQVEVTQKQMDRLEKMNKMGAIQPAALYDMKGQLASDELGIINAQNALAVSKLTLTQLMNVSFDATVQLDRNAFKSTPSVLQPYDASVSELYETALKNLGIVQAANLRQESAKMASKIASANFYPTVSLFGRLGTNYSSAAQRALPISSTDVATNNFVELNGNRLPVFSKQTNFKNDKISYFNQFFNNMNTTVGISVQIPIFNGFQTKTFVQLTQIQEKIAANGTDNIKQQLRQAIEQAYLNATNTLNRYDILKRQVAAFQQSFTVAEKRFAEGVIHSVDYLMVKNNLDRANANLINTQYDYLLRVKVLDFYRGR
ncbi:MAG: TolC family protein [Saprospiraceae bacterium]|nr:TolC family protein [Saprospiraceae bacterium]